jgi:tetratricopeptide (TPR) repeat protein
MFTPDDYLKLLQLLSESYFKLKDYQSAVSQYLSVKKRIQSEAVFDKPVMLINTLSQLGNCFLKLKDLKSAETNLLEALSLMKKYH